MSIRRASDSAMTDRSFRFLSADLHLNICTKRKKFRCFFFFYHIDDLATALKCSLIVGQPDDCVTSVVRVILLRLSYKKTLIHSPPPRSPSIRHRRSEDIAKELSCARCIRCILNDQKRESPSLFLSFFLFSDPFNLREPTSSLCFTFLNDG